MNETEIKPYKRKAAYYETDKMGVVHHSNYIRWFEETRVYYLEQVGYPYSRAEEDGVMIPVLSAECSYKNSVRFDETVYITAKITDFNGLRMNVIYTVRGEDGSVKAEGKTSHCFVDSSFRPVRVKKTHPEVYAAFEKLADLDKLDKEEPSAPAVTASPTAVTEKTAPLPNTEFVSAEQDHDKIIPAADDDPKKQIINKITSRCRAVPMLKLEPVKSVTGLWDSKLGGVPYLPKDFPYPRVKSGEYKDRPLRLLAQLNFDDLPGLYGFPQTGILQFFCSCEEDGLWGLDMNDPCGQNGFRVIYHRDIINDASKLISADDLPDFADLFPFEGEYLLKPLKQTMCRLTACDFRSGFDEISDETDDEDLLEDIYNNILTNDVTCIGGYPTFTQTDPRANDPSLRDRTILLFQLDSDPDKGIMWGDMGTGNFFISHDDLAMLDFSRVLFNWDCG